MRKIAGNDRRVIARTGRPRDRCNEAIAPSWECRDVSSVSPPITQRLAQPVHVKAQAAFLNDDIGPDPRQQIFLANDFVRGGSQDDQYIEGTRTQFDRDPLLRKEALVHQQIEWAERQAAVSPIDDRRHRPLCERPPRWLSWRLRPFLKTIKGKAIERFRDNRALEFCLKRQGIGCA